MPFFRSVSHGFQHLWKAPQILFSLIWLQTELNSTQSYSHYQSSSSLWMTAWRSRDLNSSGVETWKKNAKWLTVIASLFVFLHRHLVRIMKVSMAPVTQVSLKWKVTNQREVINRWTGTKVMLFINRWTGTKVMLQIRTAWATHLERTSSSDLSFYVFKERRIEMAVSQILTGKELDEKTGNK